MTNRLSYILCALVFAMLISSVSIAQVVSISDERIPENPKGIPVQYQNYRSTEICHNGIDDDGDGFVDCEDGDCDILMDGGFENIPVSPYPGSSVTFPPYPQFIASWAAVNIDGEVFYSSASKPASEGNKYASLLQNAGANQRIPWTEDSWNGGGYDRFLFLSQTRPNESYNVSFSHAADNRYNYLGSQTLVQIQSMESDFYYDTLITTPDLFDWQTVELSFTADIQTHNVAILFSSYGAINSSVVVDDLNFCGNTDHAIDAVEDHAVTDLNEMVVIDILDNDEHVPDDGLIMSVLIEPSHGSVVVNPDGTTSYTPYNNFVCADSFMYQICNTAMIPQSCDLTWVHVEVEGMSPTAVDDIRVAEHETELSVAVLDNDIDFDNDINVSSVALIPGEGPYFGQVEKLPNGSYTYLPDEGFIGEDQFSYVVCDVSLPIALRDTAVVYITVEEPVEIMVTETFDLIVNEDESLNVCIGSYFQTAANSELSVCTEAQNGYLMENGGCVTYYPHPNYNGPDLICLISCDSLNCDTSIFQIDVLPVNDTPDANDDHVVTNEDEQVSIAILGNDSDIDGDILSMEYVTLLNAPVHGTIIDHSDEGFVYQPYPDYTGKDSLVYLVCDNGQPDLCDWATVVIEVRPISDIYFLDMLEDTQLSFCDSLMSNLAGTITDNGIVVNNGTGHFSGDEPCFEYVPEPDFNGLDTVLITVCDQNELCDTFIFVIDVLPVNDAPIVADDEAQTGMGSTVSIDVTANDSDPADNGSMDVTSLIITESPYHGTVLVNPDGSVEYTPDTDFSGIDSFSYSICDLGEPRPALCGEAMVYIEVSGGGEEVYCMIPEAFSPNGDGLYDVFKIPCTKYYPELDLFVYDRFGNQMYQSSGGYNNDWDGSVQHSGRLLKEGTYYWVVRFNNGQTKDRAGHVLIWR